MNRRKAREYALKALYLLDSTGVDAARALDEVHNLEDSEEELDVFLERLVKGTVENLASVDRIISKYAIGWSLSRMAIVDRALLRMAIFEIFSMDDIPTSVSVNEAVELANRYSTLDSGKFINGILGKILRENTFEKDSCQ